VDDDYSNDVRRAVVSVAVESPVASFGVCSLFGNKIRDYERGSFVTAHRLGG
jgi:hypothetical protein